MADIRRVTDSFAVAPQLAPADFAELAAQGFRTVIANRPDGEAPGQMANAKAEAAAKAAGLTYVHIPFAGAPSLDVVDAMQRALRESPAPVLAFCRSGTRSITAWSLVQARAGTLAPDNIVRLAAAAGYDMAPMKGLLQRLALR